MYNYRRNIFEALQLLSAQDSESDSESNSDSGENDVEVIILTAMFIPESNVPHINYQDISEDIFENLFRLVLKMYTLFIIYLFKNLVLPF